VCLRAEEVGEERGREEEVEQHDEERRRADEEQRGEHGDDEEGGLGPAPRARPEAVAVHQRERELGLLHGQPINAASSVRR